MNFRPMRRAFRHSLAGLLAIAMPTVSKADEETLSIGGLTKHQLEQAIHTAKKHPLGSAENPVRLSRPLGYRFYLSSLRCSDGSMPSHAPARGKSKTGPYKTIIVAYNVKCPNAEPRERLIYVDIYHRNYDETRPPPGYSMAKG